MAPIHNLVRTYLMLFIFFPIFVDSAEIETHYYLENNGSQTAPVEWKFENGLVPKLTWLGKHETIITWNSISLETVKWAIAKPEQNIHITAQRKNNNLVIQGTLKSNHVEKKIKIDDSPWCQAISISLRPFVISNDIMLDFWTLCPDTLKVYKLKAVKSSVDVITINNQTFKTQKVKISLTGFLSVFGECCYWFRKDDGVFIKYEGPGAKPGEKVTVTLN